MILSLSRLDGDMCYRLGRDRGGGGGWGCIVAHVMVSSYHIVIIWWHVLRLQRVHAGGGGISAIITFPVFISGAISLSQPPYHYAIVLFTLEFRSAFHNFIVHWFGGGGAVITSSVSVSLFHFSVYSWILFCSASFYRPLMRGGGGHIWAVITFSVSVSLFHSSIYSKVSFCFASVYRTLMYWWWLLMGWRRTDGYWFYPPYLSPRITMLLLFFFF